MQLKKELDEEIGFNANTQLSEDILELLTPYEIMIGEIGIYLPTERLYVETFEFAIRKNKDEEALDDPKIIKTQSVIELLNHGIPSSVLSYIFPDFGKEKLEYPVLPERLKDPTRISPGVLTPMEYFRMMEKQALGASAFDEFGNEVFELEDLIEEEITDNGPTDPHSGAAILQLLNGSQNQALQTGSVKKRKGKRRILISPDGIVTEIYIPLEESAPSTTPSTPQK